MFSIAIVEHKHDDISIFSAFHNSHNDFCTAKKQRSIYHNYELFGEKKRRKQLVCGQITS